MGNGFFYKAGRAVGRITGTAKNYRDAARDLSGAFRASGGSASNIPVYRSYRYADTINELKPYISDLRRTGNRFMIVQIGRKFHLVYQH